MAVNAVHVTEQETRTGLGDMTFTYSNFGTPQAVMFIINGGESNANLDTLYSGDIRTHFMVGWTDGSSQFACCRYTGARSEYTQTSRTVADKCIYIWDYADTEVFAAEFKEWTTDGVIVTVTINGVPGSPYLISAVLLSGFDNIKVGTFQLTENGYDPSYMYITDVGFEPSALLFHSTFAFDLYKKYGDYGTVSFSLVLNNDPIEQYHYYLYLNNNGMAFASDAHAITYRTNNRYADVTEFVSNGFTVRNREYVDSDNMYVSTYWFGYVAIKTTESIFLGFITTSSSTGTSLLSDIGFKPTFLLGMGHSALDGINTPYLGVDAHSHGFFVSTPNEQRAFMASGTGTVAIDTRIRCNTLTNSFIAVEDFDTDEFSSYLIEAEITSRETTGVNLDYSYAATKQILLFAVGDYVPPQFHPAIANEAISVVDAPSLLREVFGSITCGHVTDVTEDNTLPFSPFFTGTAQAKGTGDSEVLVLGDNDYVESETFELGEGDCKIDQNKYGTGGEETVYYRTAATRTACDAAGWTAYTGTFTSLGFVGVKIVKEV